MGLYTNICYRDITQIDLPRDPKSGLIDALNLLGNIKGIARIDFDINDIVRHRLVQQIVQAYDNRAMNEKQKNTKKDE